MSTDKNKELFLRQVQEILNGVKQDREMVRECGDHVSCVRCVGWCSWREGEQRRRRRRTG